MCTVSAVAPLLTVEEALARVLGRVRPLPAESVPLEDAAARVLSEDARAVIDLPRFPSSAMDGFALRSADTPGTLPVVGRIAAGRPADRALAPGEAMAIATGGVVPEGADAHTLHPDADSETEPDAEEAGERSTEATRKAEY